MSEEVRWSGIYNPMHPSYILHLISYIVMKLTHRTLKYWLITGIIILIGTGCAGPGNRLEPDVKKHVRQAETHLGSGKLMLAEKSLRQAINRTRHKADVYFVAIEMTGSATTRHGMSATQTAAGFARELLDLSDRGKLDRKLASHELRALLETYSGLSFQMHQLDEAVLLLERANKLWPDDPRIANDLGYMYAVADMKLTSALQLTRRAVSSSPDNGMYVDSLGWVYYKLRRYRDAARELERAVRLLPNDAELRYHLGMAYLKTRRNAEASIEFRKCLVLDKTHAGAISELRRLRSRPRVNTPKL